ncbi:MAG: squalene--hopene cyclase [Planctomycetota bacterium]
MEWLEQIPDQLSRLWLYLTTSRVMAIIFGVAFAILALGLFIASRTKWGRAKPLTKFVALSVLLHVWLLMYAAGNVKYLPQGDLKGIDKGQDRAIALTFQPGEYDSVESPELEQPDPWDQTSFAEETPAPDELVGLDLQELDTPQEPLPELEPMAMPELPPLPEPVSPPAATNTMTEPSDFGPTTEAPSERAQQQPTPAQPANSETSPAQRPEQQLPQSTVPQEYRLRQAPNRLQLARAYGADEDTEASVAAGLKWLANAQSPDGSWNAAAYGAGTETLALGENRHGTGRTADTGVTGLALLAFLSAGQTHAEGEHREAVRSALLFLIRSQMPSGDLSGPKQLGNSPAVLNSRMYCHSIAMLALAEAHAMTRDATIREALMKAANYTIGAQDPRGGGWRYQPGDAGDLSQFGWQAMALKSVERSGIALPAIVKQRMQLFLESCSVGWHGGLATYKPGDGRPSPTMTGEALACRLMLNHPLSAEGQREAKTMIMNARPGAGEDNVYFWYYATLALFQLQDEDWRIWNQAMKERLLSTQIPAYGQQPGSWDPDRLWGGYGGRVYSTAMSCLCLEVYYRYLPMYRRDNLATSPRADAMNR